MVVCIDDDAGRKMAALAGDAITVSALGEPVEPVAEPARHAHWRAIDVVPMGAGGLGVPPACGDEFTVVDPAGVQHRVGIRMPSRYNVTN